MRKEHLKYLACPGCMGELAILEAREADGSSVETGVLGCGECGEKYPVAGHIPRFVAADNYADNFGLEWTKHARTQYDSHSGAPVSENRFFEATKWPRSLKGEIILEAGCGSGRFTEQAASTGAMVVSFDLSCAVEANYASNGGRENVLIVQADLFKPPFRESFFDKLFCLGMIQHTPDPRGAFLALPGYLKPGGRLAVDVYARKHGAAGFIKWLLTTKYWVRPITRNLPPEKLYDWCKKYVHFMWPAAGVINRIPRLGRNINLKLLIADYRGEFDLPDETLREWAVLDTFDMLSPRYDAPQHIEAVRKWFEQAGLLQAEVQYGYNGIVARGVKKQGI